MTTPPPISTFVGKVIGSKLNAKSKNHSQVYLYEPTIAEVISGRGNLYILTDMPREYEDLSSALIKSLRETYYEDIQSDALQSMEKALTIANQRIEDYGKKIVSQLQQSMRRINITCAVLVGQDLHIAQIGDNNIYLIRKGRLNKIGNVGPQTPGAIQSFANIASGKIDIGDILTFNTARLFELLPLTQFREIVTTCYPSVAASRITEHLTKRLSQDAMPSLLIVEINANSAVQDEDTKSKGLSNQLKVHKDQIAAKMTADNEAPVSGDLIEQPPTASYANQPDMPLPGEHEHLVQREENHKTKVDIAAAALNIFNLITTKLSSLKIGRKQLTRKHLFLGIALILIAVVGINILSSRQKSNPVVKSSQAYEDAMTNFTNARDVLRQNDLVNAREYLLAALTKANEAQELGIFPDATTQLVADIQKELDKLDGVTRLTDLQVFADLGTSLSASSMDLVGTTLYLMDATAQKLYALNTDNKQVTPIMNPITADARIELMSASKTALYFYGNKTGIDDTANVFYTFDPATSKVKEVTPAFTEPIKDTTVLTTWTDANDGLRLYALDGAGSALWRYRFRGSQITTPTTVINADSAQPEYAGIVDMAIDGNVYLLTRGGQLLKYVVGALDTEYRLKGLKVPMSNPVAVATFSRDETAPNATGKKIYIADRGNNRLLIFNKADGQLTNIYAADNAFIDLKDLYMDETSNLLYVLDGQKVYRLQL